jgi:hypothetical protein
MPYLVLKLFISAGVITAASELAKRSTAFSALLISLPLISILSFTWTYWESKDALKVANLSTSTLLLVIPSLAFFVILPATIKMGLDYWLSLGISVLGTFVAYLLYWKILSAFGVNF